MPKSGAHHVIDHSSQWQPRSRSRPRRAGHVISLTQTGEHFPQIAEMIAPQGRFGLIDDPVPGSIDIGLLRAKSVSLHWERCSRGRCSRPPTWSRSMCC